MAIKRIWHGWTTHDNAGSYQRLLREEVFPGIEAKNIPGYRSIELLRRELDDEVEFITIMTFDSILQRDRLSGGRLSTKLCARCRTEGAQAVG